MFHQRRVDGLCGAFDILQASGAPLTEYRILLAIDLKPRPCNLHCETPGLVKDKRYPVMTEIVEILERVTENPDEWIVPEPVKLDEKTEAGIKEAMENAKNMVRL
jgi:hypothetical protein